MSRKTMFAGLVTLVVVTLVVVMVASAFAQQQGGRGRGRGMMGDMMYLERTWTAVSFQLECTPEQIAELQPIYAVTLQTRNDALKAAMEAQDREAMTTAIADCKLFLSASLQEKLTEEQWAQLEELMSVSVMGRPGGGGQGGGGQEGGGN